MINVPTHLISWQANVGILEASDLTGMGDDASHLSVTSKRTGVTKVFAFHHNEHDDEGELQFVAYATADREFYLHVLND